MNPTYHINDTVTIEGTITSGRYLSRTQGDDKEYFNEAYYLNLDSPAIFIDKDNNSKTYDEITLIEINDPFMHAIPDFYGKKVRIKGELTTDWKTESYYRQYATPVFITVDEIKEIE